MSEPTIDEMLYWLDAAAVPELCEEMRVLFAADDVKFRKAIRAILEQHQVNQNALQILKDVQVALRPLGIELTWDGEKAGD